MKILFKEEQRFTQWWLWLLLIGIGVIPIIGIYKQLIIGEQFGDKPTSDFGLVIFFMIVFGVIVLFWVLRLKTEIDPYEIRISFFPFLKKRVNWKEVKSATIVNYGFVGFGIRLGSAYGTVYNTKGQKGLAIELKNGERFVVGTQKEKELNRIMEDVEVVV